MNYTDEKKQIIRIIDKVKSLLNITEQSSSKLYDVTAGLIMYKRKDNKEIISISNINGEIFEIEKDKEYINIKNFLINYSSIYLNESLKNNVMEIYNNELYFATNFHGTISYNSKMENEYTKEQIRDILFESSKNMKRRCTNSIEEIVKYGEKQKKRERKIRK